MFMRLQVLISKFAVAFLVHATLMSPAAAAPDSSKSPPMKSLRTSALGSVMQGTIAGRNGSPGATQSKASTAGVTIALKDFELGNLDLSAFGDVDTSR